MEKVFASLLFCMLVMYNVIQSEGLMVPVPKGELGDVIALAKVCVGTVNDQTGKTGKVCALNFQSTLNPQQEIAHPASRYRIPSTLCYTDAKRCDKKLSTTNSEGCVGCTMTVMVYDGDKPPECSLGCNP